MNNYYTKILICFIVLLLLIVSIPTKAELALQGKVIVLDAGHGGLDPGTVYRDIYEKDINLSITKYLEEELSKMGATVILTRDSDKDLSMEVRNNRKKADFDNRIKIINQDYVDMYLSIHLNYLSNTKYFGPQVFFNNDNEELASIVQKSLNEASEGNRKIKKIPGDTYMYKRLKHKGLLIECGFLSNSNERNKLLSDEYQIRIAKAITEGIILYYN